jgi:hypothetical protein
VPFHVEVRRSFHRAWRFNLGAEELQRVVLDPWRRGQPLSLGDREWTPAQSELRVIEGPRLQDADLAHGQGWNRAERSGADVTRRVLATSARAGGRVTVVAADPDRGRGVAELLREAGLELVDWASVRAAILAGDPARGGAQAAVVATGSAEPDAGGFDAGLALGAFGGRAVVAHGPPTDADALLAWLADAGVGAPDAIRPSPGPAS